MLLAGLSVLHIARRLTLSPHTARDHLKSIFEKVGVNGQQELVAACTSATTCLNWREVPRLAPPAGSANLRAARTAAITGHPNNSVCTDAVVRTERCGGSRRTSHTFDHLIAQPNWYSLRSRAQGNQ